jgi:hypothetical protein
VTLAMRRALAGTALVAMALAVSTARLRSGEAWSGLTPADCAEYCEGSERCGELATRHAVQQPLNAWSNLAYVFAGLLALGSPVTPGGVAFAASAGLLGLGSFAFHATVTREMQWLDVVGMQAASFALAARGVHEAWRVGWPGALGGWALASLGFALFKWQLPTRAVMLATGALVMAALVTVVRRGGGRARLGLAAAALMAIAYVVRELDVRKVGCDPASLVYQGHALWHLLTAVSLLAAWRAFDDAPAGAGRAPRA